MDPQNGYQSLRGNKIQNLGDGFLVRAVPKHHPVDFSPGHEIAHMGNDAFGVRFIHQQGHHIDVNGIFFAPQSPYISLGDVACLTQDHGNVQYGHFLCRMWDVDEGKESWKSQKNQPGKPHSARLHSLQNKSTHIIQAVCDIMHLDVYKIHHAIYFKEFLLKEETQYDFR